jgi:RNA polymerase-binding transcription factor DksA
MATKKKVATKIAGKKAANIKKVEPAKKAVKPAPQIAASKPLSKNGAKPADKKIVTPPPAYKKLASPVIKHTEKPAQEKTSKTVSKAAPNPIKEQVKNTPKILENKKKENSVNQPAATPPPAKAAQKKEAPAAKPAKVVMPDIKTKTVRKYEPDFTKSVLDIPIHDQSLPSQRYSDVDLNEFRELINKKLDAAKKELNYLQGLITRKDEMGGDESDNRYMTMEDGSISMEREQLSQMASRQITFIDHLEKAIMRIENKTYGICRVTGRLIDKARLRAVPHATLSIEAKQTMNK